MNPTRTLSPREGAIGLRTLPNETFTEVYLTSCPEDSVGHRATPAETFADAAKILARRGVQPMLERVYGTLAERDALLQARERAWIDHGLDPALPVTYLEGAPARGGGFAGLQVWGLVPMEPGRVLVESADRDGLPARMWKGPGFRVLFLPQVRGTTAEGALSSGVTRQGERMFANATAALEAHGFGWPGVVRTWIYLARLLDWYGEFNRVRTAHYAYHGLGSDPRTAHFPASTGIKARSLDEECFLSLLAVDATTPGSIDIQPIGGSKRQPPAFTYGSAFSRATVLSVAGRRTIHVSGTASIDAHGRTLHAGDPEAQTIETLLCTAALLDEQGGGLENISMATLYCKNREAYEAWRNVCRLLRVPEFPLVPVLADVCRHELLVELEAVATI